MATMLPTKQESLVPVATTDTVWNQMAADPTITAIPQGSTFGNAPATSRETYSAQQNQADMLKSGGGALSEGGTTTLATDDRFGNWINSRWRPLMAIIYMITCFCDFVLFPILWSLLQAMSAGQVTSQWMPLTLQGAGLYHIALGAILGVAAYGRSQEKIAGKS